MDGGSTPLSFIHFCRQVIFHCPMDGHSQLCRCISRASICTAWYVPTYVPPQGGFGRRVSVSAALDSAACYAMLVPRYTASISFYCRNNCNKDMDVEKVSNRRNAIVSGGGCRSLLDGPSCLCSGPCFFPGTPVVLSASIPYPCRHPCHSCAKI